MDTFGLMMGTSLMGALSNSESGSKIQDTFFSLRSNDSILGDVLRLGGLGLSYGIAKSSFGTDEFVPSMMAFGMFNGAIGNSIFNNDCMY